MKSKIKQKISILLYLLLSAILLAGTLFLGSKYIGKNTAPVPETGEKFIGTEEDTDDTAPETNPENVAVMMQPEIEETVGAVWQETEQLEADIEGSGGTETISSETEFVRKVPDNPVDRLMLLFEEEAPLRWARVYSANEDGETVSEFEKVYPKLAYFYKDLETGETVAYNADEILYSASLIKAPYIYAVLEEIDNFEKSRLPSAEESDRIGADTETDVSEEMPEAESSEEAALSETDASKADTSETKITYLEGEEKYNLDEIWTFDPDTMMEEGSGEILDMPAGTEMTWRELFEYTLLYSDNIAFAQLRQRFGYSSFYTKVAELGIRGVPTGFMNLSARDCAVFLEEIYAYFETGSDNAEMMRDCMTKSKHLDMIAAHYPEGMAAHKYGWDIGAFHDMAIIYDEHPYLLVIMTDYEDGGSEPAAFMGEVVALTKEIHASIHSEEEVSETEAAESETVKTAPDET